MPIIKSAKKAMRQTARRTERNKLFRSDMKTMVKKVLEISKNDAEDAKKLLPKAYSSIDKACKKNLIHANNAARKKARLAKVVAAAEAKKK
ncbi:30S ribosomal protein S20 [Candidatus Peregrinibacteria bacterium]|nr:30S ribosomal protein S20 [Candidatus Peregrinibacteria bacterium]